MALHHALRAATPVLYVSSSGTRSGTSPITVTAPSGILNGDLLIAWGMNGSQTQTVTLPSGFTSLTSDTSGLNSEFVAYKVASSESGNYSFTWGGTVGRNIQIAVFRNASTVVAGSFTKANSNTSTGASITVSSGLLVGIFGAENTPTISTAPSGMTSILSTTGGPQLSSYYQSVSGSSGNKTLVWSGTNDNFGILLNVY